MLQRLVTPAKHWRPEARLAQTQKSDYQKGLQTHLLVEGWQVHGYHVHPRKLDEHYVEIEDVVEKIDEWLDLRQKSVREPTAEDEAAWEEIRSEAEESVQFKLIISQLHKDNYRGIASSKKVASVIIQREGPEGEKEELDVAAVRYLETIFTAEEVQKASVSRVDPEKYVLQRISRDSEACEPDAPKIAIDEWLHHRGQKEKESEEVTGALRTLETWCKESALFQLGLTKLFDKDYLNLRQSVTIQAMVLERKAGKSLTFAAAHATGAPKFSHPSLGDNFTGDLIYVTKGGKVYAAEKADDIQHTSFFGANELVESSGWLRMYNGSIVGYRRWSGHFLPEEGSEKNFRDWVSKHGLQVQERSSDTGYSDWLDVELVDNEPPKPSGYLASFVRSVMPARRALSAAPRKPLK